MPPSDDLERQLAEHRARALELAEACAARIRELEGEIAALRAEERTLRNQADDFGEEADALRALTPQDRARKLRRMEAEIRAPRRGRPVKHPHPLLDVTNVTEWAEKHGHKRRTVRSWMDGSRPIPRRVVDEIAAEFVDPQTGRSLVPPSSWSNISE